MIWQFCQPYCQQWGSGRGGDFLIFHAMVVGQHEHFALTFGQGVERILQTGTDQVVAALALGIGRARSLQHI